jgi:hypothetical protein
LILETAMPRSHVIFAVFFAFFSAAGAPVHGQTKHPAEEKGVKSLEGHIPTVLKLVNKSKQTVKVFWINYEGKREAAGTLAPGKAFDTNTFLTHPFLATDAQGNAWAIYLPDAQARVVEFTGPAVKRPSPTSVYEKREIAGFTVLVHPDLIARSEDAAEALAEMEKQLNAITKVVPAKPLAEIRKVRIWLEWDSYGASAAQFHPSTAGPWLQQHGLNANKVGCVDINNARHFIDWSRQDQPWMVMHELAHAYHNLVLGAQHEGIRSAYKQAVERKLYESVAHVSGKKQKAYALTNDQEYFAELTEAYFGRNDFFPFDRADLEKHDPAGYRLMREVWGDPKVR